MKIIQVTQKQKPVHASKGMLWPFHSITLKCHFNYHIIFFDNNKNAIRKFASEGLWSAFIPIYVLPQSQLLLKSLGDVGKY